jgi:hypothetical protein
MTFETHEEWRQELMEAFLEAPPPGYRSPGLSQLVKADQEMFHALQRLCRKGIRSNPDGSLPMDRHYHTAASSRRVKLMLNPLPGGQGTKRSRSRSQGRGKPQKPGKQERGNEKPKAPTQREEEARAKAIKEVFKPKEEKGKKDKDKKNPGPRLPKELVGHNGMVGGVPLCYSYNLQSCKDAEPGQRCKRGLHLCARKGCEKEEHAFKDCPRRFG